MVINRADYVAPAYWIDTVELCFDLDPAKTRVLNKMKLRHAPLRRLEQRVQIAWFRYTF